VLRRVFRDAEERPRRPLAKAGPRISCPACSQPTHPVELVSTDDDWLCARCVEEHRLRSMTA
jgi:hypothetical protein